MIVRPVIATAVIALIVALVPTRAWSHPEGFSGLRIVVRDGDTTAIVSLHTRDLSQWFPSGRFADYATDVSAQLAAHPDELLEVRADGAVIAPQVVRTSLPDVGLIEVELRYPIGAGCAELAVWSKHLVRLPRGHQQMFFAVDARGTSVDANSVPVLREEVLSIDNDSVSVEVPPRGSNPATFPATAAAAPPRISFFALGVEHIVTGYDHLLFLAALLLVCRNFREAAAVITFFTVAHSITLSLAALNVVRLPGRIVEPAIAASIVYVGLENVFGKHRFVWRALVTFAFGLVHGLGFASALREVGLGSTSVGLAMPLLKFSLGLEVGQLCIAAILLKVLLTLKRRDEFDRHWVPAGSALVSVIGMYWLVTRVLAG